MTRRTTVIQPSTTTDALYTLPNQPFTRRIVSASLYGYDNGYTSHAVVPELKIADVEGNVLAAISTTIDWTASVFTPRINWFFGDLGGTQWDLNYPTQSGLPNVMPIYFPTTIPPDLCVPVCNLFTVTLWGSQSGDLVIPNLVLVTEDDDEDNYKT